MDEQPLGPRKPFLLDLDAIVGADPENTLRDIVSELNSQPEPSEKAISMIGIGPLESLLHLGVGDRLWPEIERLARSDPRFRRALSYVWAYDSPEFERREQLLEELGEQPGGL